MIDADVLIVGSGPTGISAAWPLVLAGLSVVMVDASGHGLPASPRVTSLAAWRDDPNHWRDILGGDLGGLKANNRYSPKFTTPLGRAVINRGLSAEPSIGSDTMVVARSANVGGLSTMWGGLCATYNDQDLSAFPISALDLAEGYRAVATRIGISGDETDPQNASLSLLPPGPLTKPVQFLYEAYKQGSAQSRFKLDVARNAVLTKDRGERKGCIRCGMCLYGCAHKSIYNSGDELPALQKFSRFRYIPHATVRKLMALGAAQHSVELKVGEEIVVAKAKFIFLAAGTLNSTALLMDYFEIINQPVRLLSNPVAGMSFIVPHLIATPFMDQSFSLGQLSYQLEESDKNPNVCGVFYGADTLPLDLFARRMPLSRPASLRLSAALAPALIMATCYLPGRYSDNKLTLQRRDRVAQLALDGTTSQAARDGLLVAGRRLASELKKLGVYRIPGSMTISPPGSDAHLAGTIPMGGQQRLSCSSMCEVAETQGVYVVDGSWMPDLPAKHCTFTLMANAHRVGTHVANKFSSHA